MGDIKGTSGGMGRLSGKHEGCLNDVGEGGGGKYDDEKRMHMERYKIVKKEARMTIMVTKMTTFGHLYEELENKGGEKKLYRLTKVLVT